jgi:hypothetical protein
MASLSTQRARDGKTHNGAVLKALLARAPLSFSLVCWAPLLEKIENHTLNRFPDCRLNAYLLAASDEEYPHSRRVYKFSQNPSTSSLVVSKAGSSSAASGSHMRHKKKGNETPNQ